MREPGRAEERREGLSKFSTSLRRAILGGESVAKFWKPAKRAERCARIRREENGDGRRTLVRGWAGSFVGGETFRSASVASSRSMCRRMPREGVEEKDDGAIDLEMKVWVDGLLSQDFANLNGSEAGDRSRMENEHKPISNVEVGSHTRYHD